MERCSGVLVSMAAASLAAAALTACRGEPAAHREVAREVSPGAGAAPAAVPRVVRGNLTTELVPEPSPESKARIARYLEVRRADLAGWDAAGTGVFVLTRLANVPQLHRVDAPLGMRRGMRGVRALRQRAHERWRASCARSECGIGRERCALAR